MPSISMVSSELWRLQATDLARLTVTGAVSAQEAVSATLGRIHATNPGNGAVVEVLEQEALAEARALDAQRQRGEALGPLHGVPVLIKVNIDVAGHANTDGVVALKNQIAHADAPLVASMRQAGAVVVGLTNTPAYSMRWFTDNDLHGRTLNPFDPSVTPGGSSGGAAAAVALGMCSIAHGNDFGGSVRYPAWACGVVGLRTTPGRIPSYCETAPLRSITLQQMSTQGPLTRSIADARLALQVMANGSPLDPQWVAAPLEQPESTPRRKVALMREHPAYPAHPEVRASLEQAAAWLEAAGYEVTEVQPPHFEEAAQLWRHLVMEDARRTVWPELQRQGDQAVKQAVAGFFEGLTPWSADQVFEGLQRRFSIARDWSVFLEEHEVLLMPVSWENPFAVDEDQRGHARMAQMMAAQSPMLSTALLGLPGLSVPTGLSSGLPTGVQLVAHRFREDRLLRTGAVIEAAAGFNALQHLAS